MKGVVETWESMKFIVQPYFKGTQQRGYILGGVDEILLNVDNDIMNLQSMAGSRFVGPFLGTVQQWEKDLSLISETIEVSKMAKFHMKPLLFHQILTHKMFLSGVAAGTKKMDVPGVHIHWRRHSLTVT